VSVLAVVMNELCKKNVDYDIPRDAFYAIYDFAIEYELGKCNPRNLTNAANVLTQTPCYNPDLVVNDTKLAFWFMVEGGSKSTDALYRLSFGEFSNRIDVMSFAEKDSSSFIVFEAGSKYLTRKRQILKYEDHFYKSIDNTMIVKSFSQLSIGNSLYYYDYRFGWTNATLEKIQEVVHEDGKTQTIFSLSLEQRFRQVLEWSDECLEFFDMIDCSSQIIEEEHLDLPTLVDVDSMSPALSLNKHVMYSSTVSFSMSLNSKIFFGLTGEDLPHFVPEEKLSQRLAKGSFNGINKLLHFKKTALKILYCDHIYEKYTYPFQMIVRLLDHFLHLCRSLFLEFLIRESYNLHKDQCCRYGIYKDHFFWAFEIFLRRIFPASQARGTYDSVVKLIVRNLKRCPEYECSRVAFKLILETFMNSHTVFKRGRQDCNFIRTRVLHNNKPLLTNLYEKDNKTKFTKVLKRLVIVKPHPRAILISIFY
jgi:hypothetical protein